MDQDKPGQTPETPKVDGSGGVQRGPKSPPRNRLQVIEQDTPHGPPASSQGAPAPPQEPPTAPRGSSAAPQGPPTAPHGPPASSQGAPAAHYGPVAVQAPRPYNGIPAGPWGAPGCGAACGSCGNGPAWNAPYPIGLVPMGFYPHPVSTGYPGNPYRRQDPGNRKRSVDGSAQQETADVKRARVKKLRQDVIELQLVLVEAEDDLKEMEEKMARNKPSTSR